MLQLKEVSISFAQHNENKTVVSGLSFTVKPNTITGIVGESGSGKSVSTLAILGLLPKDKATVTGSILFEGQELVGCSEQEFLSLRGSRIAMIFQEPMSSLNPTLTCGYQVAEVLRQHTPLSSKEIKKSVLTLFEEVKLPRPESIYTSYPHQISGGQKQRVMIAMALACKPTLLIADEPTTALDVTVQKDIIGLLKDLQASYGMSIIFISHDLALVSEIANQVVVMHQGRVVEQGTAEQVFKHPQENYTKALIQSRPNVHKRLKTLPTVADFTDKAPDTTEYTTEERKAFHEQLYTSPPILEVKDVHKTYIQKGGWFAKDTYVSAVDGVSFSVYKGETLGLVGESGCGKTTLGRTIMQLEKATEGIIYYKGTDISRLRGKALKELRKEIQIIFQDPFSSLHPRMQIGEAILEPMKVHGILNSNEERKAYVLDLLEKVGLEKEHYHRYPHEFSGGQRQRIGIARAIALRPKIVICDESVSALDVSVQAQVLNLLNQLKEEFQFTYIFISHDLSVVKYMSDQLLVMQHGKIAEIGDADELYRNPKSAYTQTLIQSIPKGI